MNVHENARMTVRGRVLLVKRIVEGRWRLALAAEAAGISVRTAYKWLARYRAGGEAMVNASLRRQGILVTKVTKQKFRGEQRQRRQ